MFVLTTNNEFSHICKNNEVPLRVRQLFQLYLGSFRLHMRLDGECDLPARLELSQCHIQSVRSCLFKVFLVESDGVP